MLVWRCMLSYFSHLLSYWSKTPHLREHSAVNYSLLIWIHYCFLQEHIEALYNYVEKLQESKADKENVAMEMDIKADKASLDSKVNISTFDNTFSMLDEGLREALQKMDDYMNEEMALKQALKQLSVDMSEKMDGQAFQALKNYLGESRVVHNLVFFILFIWESRFQPQLSGGLFGMQLTHAIPLSTQH